MSTTIIILSILLWGVSVVVSMRRQAISPILSFVALALLSMAEENGYKMIPLNGMMLMGWLCMTIIVVTATMMQPAALLSQNRGMGYILGGALTGMVVGLLGFSFSNNISLLYGTMIVATIVGAFVGFLMYTNTPGGKKLSIHSGLFFRYLVAKGFPVAISVMMMGVALVLTIAIRNVTSL